jgi:hypothetical protein
VGVEYAHPGVFLEPIQPSRINPPLPHEVERESAGPVPLRTWPISFSVTGTYRRSAGFQPGVKVLAGQALVTAVLPAAPGALPIELGLLTKKLHFGAIDFQQVARGQFDAFILNRLTVQSDLARPVEGSDVKPILSFGNDGDPRLRLTEPC